MRQRLNIGRDLHGLLLQFGRLASVTQTGRAAESSVNSIANRARR